MVRPENSNSAHAGHGKATLADPKISPDGKSVSFVRDHNLWVVNISDGKERALTQGGTKRFAKAELDWVYPEELEIKTAYWWAAGFLRDRLYGNRRAQGR